MRVVITGGHHSSALPVISELQALHPDLEIYWLGHKYSMRGNKNPTLEYQEITAMGISFYELKAGKFYKTYNIGRLLKIPYGFFQAFYYLIKLKPDVILSFGGYLAVPVVLAGWVLRIPAVTHEQTVVAGYANKLIARFAKRIFVSWDDSCKFFPKSKVFYTGLPLRSALFEVRSNEFDINPALPTIYITAGKTGSHSINMVVKEIQHKLLEICNVIHQCGDHSQFNDYELLTKNLAGKTFPGKLFVRKFVYEDNIGEVFAKASVFVSRSGAHTTKEILTFKKKAVLIPIPWVSHNEQYENAKVAVKEGLAVIVDEPNLTPSLLLEAIRERLAAKTGYDQQPEFSNEPAYLIAKDTLAYAKKG